jgi:hypothetical protein
MQVACKPSSFPVFLPIVAFGSAWRSLNVSATTG